MKLRFLLALGTLVATTTVAHAGALGGPQVARNVVPGFESHSYVIAFYKGKVATVEVMGDQSSNLDCMVYDSEGNLVASDVDPTDYCVLAWVPDWTSKFKIKIRNRGSKANEYKLTTN